MRCFVVNAQAQHKQLLMDTVQLLGSVVVICWYKRGLNKVVDIFCFWMLFCVKSYELIY